MPLMPENESTAKASQVLHMFTRAVANEAGCSNAAGYTHSYTTPFLENGQPFDYKKGTALASAIQQGFKKAGFQESVVKIRYEFDRLSANGASPILEFQLDTTLDRTNLLAAIDKTKMAVAAFGRVHPTAETGVATLR